MLVVSLAAIQIDIYGDPSEVDKETVDIAKKILVGTCQQGTEIEGIDFYSTTKHIYSKSLKLMLESQACKLDNMFRERLMDCKKGLVTGSTVTYVENSVCDRSDNIKNFIATHIPTDKIGRVEKIAIHVNMALKAYKDMCPKKLGPSCEIDSLGKGAKRTETPYVTRNYKKYNPDSESEYQDTETDDESWNEGRATDPATQSSTTTMRTTTMSFNDTEYYDPEQPTFYVPETQDEWEEDEDYQPRGNARNSEDKRREKKQKLVDKMMKITDNVQAIADNMGDDSDFDTQDIIIIVCVCIACVMMIMNTIIQYVKNKALTTEEVRGDLQDLRESARILQNRLWSTRYGNSVPV